MGRVTQDLFSLLGWRSVKTFGAKGDGVTDDTTPVQAAINKAATDNCPTVYWPPGIYLVGQIFIPIFQLLSAPIVPFRLIGASPQSKAWSVVGAIATPVAGSIIKSNTTAGPVFSCLYDTGGSYPFSGIQLTVENLTIRTYDNPQVTAWDFSAAAAVKCLHLIADTGVYNVTAMSQPTHAAAYGFKYPAVNNGAYTKVVGGCSSGGYYTGHQSAEHLDADEIAGWGCLRALEVPGLQNHEVLITKLADYHCPRGIVATGGKTRIDVTHHSVEWSASGWWTRVYDVDDSGNLLKGVTRYASVQAGVGPSSQYLKNSATGFVATDMGE